MSEYLWLNENPLVWVEQNSSAADAAAFSKARVTGLDLERQQVTCVWEQAPCESEVVSLESVLERAESGRGSEVVV